MSWNIAAECISLVILGIIWVYSRKDGSLPTLTNKLFQCCFLATFCAMSTNIISTVMILHYTMVPLWINWLVTTIYFIFTPLIGLFYYLYSASIIYDGHPVRYRTMVIGSLPGILYVALVLINIVNRCIFDINLQDGYVKGPWIMSTYVIFYLYCLASILIAVIGKKYIDRHIFNILAAFPVIAVIVIVIQQFYPSVILSGSAATCALLIVYLHLQNKQISIDYLTNVPNRHVLLKYTDMMITRNPSGHFVIIVISLRDFKHINQSYGQENGDLLLKNLCQFLCSITPAKSVYRFKGDEFAILLKNSAESQVKRILNDLSERMQLPWELKDYSCVLSYVTGIGSYPESATIFEDVINATEYAVSIAKSDPHNSTCFCNQEIFSRLQRKRQIIRILRQKIKDNDLELYYQPIVLVESGRFLYAESLLRIPDSPIGPLYPSEFIPIAEETGLIIEMTYQILDKACKFVNHLIESGIGIRAVHVNFSAVQFREHNLAQKVLEIIDRNQTPHSSIKIEFTESTIADNIDQVTEFAMELKKCDIRMGLDDFGMGYSNLATVIQIPFSTIKLDKSLVWAAMNNERSSVAVTNLVHIFKSLDMTVIAEGVETEEQNQYVIRNKVDQIQGYFYAKPMCQSDTEEFLLNHQKTLRQVISLSGSPQ